MSDDCYMKAKNNYSANSSDYGAFQHMLRARARAGERMEWVLLDGMTQSERRLHETLPRPTLRDFLIMAIDAKETGRKLLSPSTYTNLATAVVFHPRKASCKVLHDTRSGRVLTPPLDEAAYRGIRAPHIHYNLWPNFYETLSNAPDLDLAVVGNDQHILRYVRENIGSVDVSVGGVAASAPQQFFEFRATPIRQGFNFSTDSEFIPFYEEIRITKYSAWPAPIHGE